MSSSPKNIGLGTGAVALVAVLREDSVRGATAGVVDGAACAAPEVTGAASPMTASVSCTGWSTAVVSAVE